MKIRVFKTFILTVITFFLQASPSFANSTSKTVEMATSVTSNPVTVAAYYFPNYHPGDKRNSIMPGKGPEWSEWDLVKKARAKYPGHHQPKVPQWGYGDESDPSVMAQKLDAAADHGVDAFIFDWYYYNDGPFLNDCLDKGYLRAPNNHRVKFALMWANHDWLELHPSTRGTTQSMLFPAKVSPEKFDQICEHVITDYFSQPNYWTIQGKPYFSFYDIEKLVQNFPTVDACRSALKSFRKRAQDAELPGLHLNAVVWGRPILPGENTPTDIEDLVSTLGFDSATSYVWIHHVGLNEQQTDYNKVRDEYFKYWSKVTNKLEIPYFPNVTMGWDSSPRTNQADEWGNWGYPFTNNISNNTPEHFQKALEMTRDRILQQPYGSYIININCWNEWTEGSYLEPDTRNGLKYLEAVKNVFGQN